MHSVVRAAVPRPAAVGLVAAGETDAGRVGVAHEMASQVFMEIQFRWR